MKYAMQSAKDFHDGHYTSRARIAIGASIRIMSAWLYTIEVRSRPEVPILVIVLIVSVSFSIKACIYEVRHTKTSMTIFSRNVTVYIYTGTLMIFLP